MNKIESLQALRAIAFICIFLSHCDVIPTGPMGVSIFLVLSGFLMFRSSYIKGNEPEIKQSFRFAVRKILRLYPLHILTLLAMISVTVMKAGEKGGQVISKAVLNGLLLQAWIPDSEWYFTFNKVSWYLSVSLFLYFAFPYIYHNMQILSLKQNISYGGVLLTIQIICSVLLNTIFHGVVNEGYLKWFTYICPLYRLFDFYYGMLLSATYFQCSRVHVLKDRQVVVNTAEIILIILWTFQILLYRESGLISEAFRYSLFWLISSVMAVALFTSASGVITKVLNNKLLVFIGNISGTAFLLHQIIIGVMEKLFENTWIIAGSACAVTLITSCAYQFAEEKVRGFVYAHTNA